MWCGLQRRSPWCLQAPFRCVAVHPTVTCAPPRGSARGAGADGAASAPHPTNAAQAAGGLIMVRTADKFAEMNDVLEQCVSASKARVKDYEATQKRIHNDPSKAQAAPLGDGQKRAIAAAAVQARMTQVQ